MTPPTWEQLIADNRATAGRAIRARVHHSYNVGNGWSTQHVWFMPPERWRIDDEAGEPRIVRSDHWMFRRIDESGVMERYDAIPQANPVTTEEPHELLVAYRLWPAPPAPRVTPHDAEGLFARMTVHTIGPVGIEPTGPAETSVVRGRYGWTVPCLSHNTTPPTKLTLTFDDATGVVIGRNVGARYNTVELSDLALDEDFDEALFDWQPEGFHDATAAARDEQRKREEHFAALAAVPQSTPTYWPGGGQITHHAHDGDTTTWSLLGALRRDGLDVADMQRWPARLRRPFPAPSDPGNFTWTDESWTYVITPRQQLAADEIERIKSSIATVEKPQSLGEVVDADREKTAQHAVIAGAATIFAGTARVTSHALYFTTAPDYLIPSVDGEPFRGQVNGWIGAAIAPVLEFATGLHSGTVDLEIRLEPLAPPLDLEQWDDVVEVPFSTDTTEIILSSLDGEIAKLHIPLGRYRIRLSASGVDAAHDADTGAGIDRYQLLFWPDESRPDEIIKQTSAQVAYYHRTCGGSQRTQ